MHNKKEISIFCKCLILSSLVSKDLKLIYEKSERLIFKKNKEAVKNIIFDKGDAGNCLYIVIDGAVIVTDIDLDGNEKIVNHFLAGDYFGEQALFERLKNRTARAIVISNSCILRKINQKEFDEIILAKQRGLYEKLKARGNLFLQQDSLIFSHFLSEHADKKIKKEKIEPGSFVYKEGEVGDRFYLILEGIANVFRNDVLVAELIDGNYFGSTSLINQMPHQVSIKAGDNLNVVSIDGTEFLKLYKNSEAVRIYIHSMDGFNKHEVERGIVYSGYQSHYKNKKSLTTVLTYPHGKSCSITKVIGKNHILKIAKQIDVAADDGKTLGKEDIELCKQDLLDISDKNANAPHFYLQNNRLLGAETNAEYDYLDNIIPAIMAGKRINCFQRALYKSSGNLWIKSVIEDPTDSAVICPCVGATRGELKALVVFGYDSYDTLANKSGASKACGFCAPSVAEIAASSSKMMQADIISSLTDNYCNKKQDIKYFRFKPKNSPVETYFPGQHIRLETKIGGQWVQRAYTLISDANQKDYYEVAVRLTQKGLFSNWLHNKLHSQSEIFISKPQGYFHLNPSTNNPVVCFVAGVGVTPAIAFLRYFISTTHNSPLYIDYSISTDADLAFENEFNAIQMTGVTFKKRVTAGGNRISKKDVQKIVSQHSQADFFICGGKLYDEAIQSYLLSSGVEVKNIHSEQFNNSQKNPIALLMGSVLTLCFALLFFVMPSLKIPSRVGSFDLFGLLPSDYTGYGILGLGALGLSIAFPRRWVWIRKFDKSTWQLMHVWLGVIALILFFLHTGFSMGGLHTTILSSCFLGIFILGSAIGITISLQDKLSLAQTYIYKKRFKWLHILLSWPLPALLLAHILSTYTDSWF